MNNKLAIFYPPFLYIAIMLFIVGEGTIALDLAKKWASFYSHTISTTLLMIATIILGFFSGMNRRTLGMIFSYRLILPLLPIILFILACYVDVFINLFSSNVDSSYIAFLIRYLLFIFLIIQAISCSRFFLDVSKPYYHLMLFVLITGGLLFFLNILVNDITQFSTDVSFLKKVDEGNLGKNLYSMPFGMGLLITGQNLASFLGLNFYQFSSYFFEPQVFGFIMVPAFIIFLDENFIPYSKYKFLMILIGLILILWAHSFTTISALLGVGLVWLFFRNIFGAIFVLSLSIILLIFVINSFDELSLSLSLFNKLTSSSGNTSLELFTSIWQNLSLTGDGTLNIRIGEKGEYLSVFSLFFWGIFVFTIFINAISEILSNKNNVFGYAFLFLLICFFKSLWHAPQSFISIYICLIFLAYKCSQELKNYSANNNHYRS